MTDPTDNTERSDAADRTATDAKTPSRRSAYRRIHVWGSVCLYLVSLALPGFDTRAAGSLAYGIEVLLVGWLGPLDGHFAWFSNPLYFVALVRAPRLKSSIQLAGFALILALSFLLHDTIASGDRDHPIELRAGYFVWIASIALYCGGQVWTAWTARRR